MNYIFTVQDHFDITGRGCVIVPGIPEKFPSIQFQAPICLVKPNGEEMNTYIQGIEMIKYIEVPKERTSPILLPNDFTKQDVPIGTKVYLRDDREN